MNEAEIKGWMAPLLPQGVVAIVSDSPKIVTFALNMGSSTRRVTVSKARFTKDPEGEIRKATGFLLEKLEEVWR